MNGNHQGGEKKAKQGGKNSGRDKEMNKRPGNKRFAGQMVYYKMVYMIEKRKMTPPLNLK